MRKRKQEKPSEPSGSQKERKRNRKNRSKYNCLKSAILQILILGLSVAALVYDANGGTVTSYFYVLINGLICLTFCCYDDELYKRKDEAIEETVVKEHEKDN